MREERELRRRESHVPALDQHPPAVDLHPHHTHREDLLPGRPAVGPPQDGPDPRHQLARAERLRDVVVGAELEAEHAVDLVVPRGDEQDLPGAARLVSFLRATANNAQQQLTRELGPEFQNLDFRDLNPRSFIQKNLLDNSLVADVKAEISGVGETLTESQESVRSSIDGAKDVNPGGPNDVMAGATPDRTPFDAEAT